MDNPKKAFSQIFDENIDKIYRFIYLKVNSQEIAQDLCSETFSRGWQSFKQDCDNIENPRAFLYQIARNLIVDHYRDKARTQIVSVDKVSIIDPREDLEQKTCYDSDIDMIKSVLTDVKPEYQDLVIWHYVDELSVPEIAKITSKSEGAVRTALHRALKAVKNKIEQA